MKESLELDRYIERLRESGRVDSEGSFTMAGVRAVGTLSQFLLSSPGDWLLKIVQSACAGGSRELKIRQTRLSTQAEFIFPDLVDLTLLERCFVDPSIRPQSRAIHHLVTGLRALQAGEERTWVARIVSGEERSLLQCLSSSVSARRETVSAPFEGTKIELAATYPRNDFGKIGGVRFGDSIQEEYLSLLSRARACPIPLLFDRRRLDDLGEPSTSGLQTRLYLGVTYSKTRAEGILIPPKVRARIGERRRGDRLSPYSPFYLAVPPAEGRAGAIVCWHFNYTVLDDPKRRKALTQKIPAGSRVLLVHDGVVVGSRSLGIHHPISTDILLNGDHLTTDLSGLKIEPDTEHVHLAKLELKDCLGELRTIRGLLSEHYPRPSVPNLLLYGGLGAIGLMFPALGAKIALGGYSAFKLHLSARERKMLLNLARDAIEEYERLMSP